MHFDTDASKKMGSLYYCGHFIFEREREEECICLKRAADLLKGGESKVIREPTWSWLFLALASGAAYIPIFLESK